jgi:uncharacterized membrane protein
MSWIALALIGPLLWSIGNHIDKFLIEKYFKNKTIGSLLIFSSLIGLFIAPVIYILKPDVLNIGLEYIFLILVASIMFVIFVWSYLKAMEDEEASIAVPFFQLIPVFAYILGYFFLGEIITNVQVLAMFLIIVSASILSFEIDEENKFKLRKKTVFFMTLSSLASAVDSVIFKYVILEEDFWISSFWSFTWIGIIGLTLLLLFKTYRKDFFYSIRNNSKPIIGLNIVNETLSTIANVATAFATLLAPVALVLSVNAYQPVFVFIIGIFLTVFFPEIATEKIKLKHILQKVLVIGVMLVGTYLLFV